MLPAVDGSDESLLQFYFPVKSVKINYHYNSWTDLTETLKVIDCTGSTNDLNQFKMARTDILISIWCGSS